MVQQALPDAQHSYCYQHLAANVQKEFGLACQQYFWGAAKANTRERFNAAMDKLRAIKQEAFNYVNAIPHNEWASYAFPLPQYGHITSNAAESLNAAWNNY